MFHFIKVFFFRVTNLLKEGFPAAIALKFFRMFVFRESNLFVFIQNKWYYRTRIIALDWGLHIGCSRMKKRDGMFLSEYNTCKTEAHLNCHICSILRSVMSKCNTPTYQFLKTFPKLHNAKYSAASPLRLYTFKIWRTYCNKIFSNFCLPFTHQIEANKKIEFVKHNSLSIIR